jgi:hypothetical protein
VREGRGGGERAARPAGAANPSERRGKKGAEASSQRGSRMARALLAQRPDVPLQGARGGRAWGL